MAALGGAAGAVLHGGPSTGCLTVSASPPSLHSWTGLFVDEFAMMLLRIF